MKKYKVEIFYNGIIEEDIEAETQEDAEFEATDISVMEVPSEADVNTIEVWEV